MTPTQIKKVVVAGATGNLGPAIIQALLASNFTVFALTRLESTAVIPGAVQVIKTNYSPESIASIFEANTFDAVVSALDVTTTAVLNIELYMIDAALNTGVKHFIPSNFGGDNTQPLIAMLVPALTLKNASMEKLRNVESDTFSWTAIATGMFFDWAFRIGFINIDVKNKVFTVFDDGNNHFSSTKVTTIGKAVANILNDPTRRSLVSNKLIFIASYHLTQNSLFTAVEKVWMKSGRSESWIRNVQSSAEIAEKAKERVHSGDLSAVGDQIRTSVFGPSEIADHRGKVSNELLDLPVDDLEADIKDLLDELVPL